MAYTRRSRMDYYSGKLLEKCVAADLEVLDRVEPDLVVGDFRWTMSISAEIRRVPYCSILNTLWTNYYDGVRSVPEGLLLRRIIGKRAVAAIGPMVKGILSWMWARPFNRYRKRLGLPPRANLIDHIYGDLNLLPDLARLFPTRDDLPANFHRVGPIFWKGGKTSDPKRLPAPSDRPLIYASIGSTGTDLFLQRLFEGLGSLDIDVVMSTGGQPLPGQPPRNFHCLDLVAPEDVLPHAALAVCHGGNGTVYQCLSYGVPVLGIATHIDQQWNLDRVADCGVGWRFTEENVTSKDIRSCVRAVIDEPQWRQSAVEIGREINAADGAAQAARVISDWLASR
ncbi:MAG: hypothetical protein HKN60_09020 [Rhizobiales bacterium]|nr:hypothetical protein [Hyphomicrobiales bacterium]